MEWAQALVILSCLSEAHIGADHIDNVQLVFYLLYRIAHILTVYLGHPLLFQSVLIYKKAPSRFIGMGLLKVLLVVVLKSHAGFHFCRTLFLKLSDKLVLLASFKASS